MKTSIKFICLGVLFLFFHKIGYAQQPKEMVVDSLSNGLKYYIQPNPKPEKNLELRLVVRVGSMQEDDTQLGLAHFVEHMNFNGTKRFKKRELIEKLESLGINFGADLNAGTTMDYTEYILPVPTDKEGNTELGFQVLSDWAQGALLEGDDIDDERKIIIEEERIFRVGDVRVVKQTISLLLKGTKYPDRFPTGTEEGLKTFPHEELRRFHREWYRPDLMAVIVVGDITVDRAKQLINKYFSGLKNPVKERPRIYSYVEPYSQSSAHIIKDDEQTEVYASIYASPQRVKALKTIEDYKDDFLKSLFIMMVNKRLSDLAKSGNAPFMSASLSLDEDEDTFGKNSMLSLDIGMKEDFKAGLDAAVAELLKAERFGFTKGEYEFRKKEGLSYYDNLYNERDKLSSSYHVGRYEKSFLRGNTVFSVEEEITQGRKFYNEITAADVSAEAKKQLAYMKNYLGIAVGPNKESILPSSEEAFSELLEQAFHQEVTAPEAMKVREKFIETPPVPGKIVSEKYDKALDVTTYTLSNHVKVTVKKTDFKSDQILLKGVKKGGSTNYGVEDINSARFMTAVVGSMGFGGLTPVEINNSLAGKTVSMGCDMSTTGAWASGSSSVKDFSTLMELLYLRLTAPTKNEPLFDALITNLKTKAEFLKNDPFEAFKENFSKKIYANNPLALTSPTKEDIEKINVDRALELYKQTFANANGYHFFIIGNVDINAIKPLIETYIGGLPYETGVERVIKDNGLRAIDGKHSFDFYKGKEARSIAVWNTHKLIPYSEDLRMKAQMLTEMLNIRITDYVREEKQLIYAGGMDMEMQKYPFQYASMTAGLPCNPDKAKETLAALEEVVEESKTKLTDDALQKVKANMIKNYHESLKDNNYWSTSLEGILLWDNSKKRFLNTEQLINKVTVKDLQKTAKEFFDDKNVVTGVLYPENQEEGKK